LKHFQPNPPDLAGDAVASAVRLPCAEAAGAGVKCVEVQAIKKAAEPTFLSSLASGAASRASKELVLHPIDTVRARLQTRNAPSSSYSVAAGDGDDDLYEGLYSGLAPALLAGVPAGAIFFAVKDTTKKYLKNRGYGKKTATILSIAAANVPYWLVRNPSEVLKTRQQVASGGSDNKGEEEDEAGSNNILDFVQGSSREELYRGYGSNIAYAYPADVIKFLTYETLVEALYDGRRVEGLQAAVAGACAGLTAQVVTTPLDVVRTRVMLQQDGDGGEGASSPVLLNVRGLYEEEGPAGLFLGLKPRSLRALGSGAIQFATYEVTQNAFSR
jgi:solute carrier family 25 S-adenosylmethionine transporter 26